MENFILKKHAIGYIKRSNNNNLQLFQEDIIDNKKKFIVSSYDIIYNKIINGRNNLYESWHENSNYIVLI